MFKKQYKAYYKISRVNFPCSASLDIGDYKMCGSFLSGHSCCGEGVTLY